MLIKKGLKRQQVTERTLNNLLEIIKNRLRHQLKRNKFQFLKFPHLRNATITNTEKGP